MYRTGFGATVLATVLLVLTAGCGGGGDDTATAELAEAATTTALLEPPCYGLAEVNTLPEWIDNLAFGESHDIGSGNFIDLREMVGCSVAGGVVVVTEAGVFENAYMDNCIDFEADDISVDELRPPIDKLWFCTQPGSDPGMFFQVSKWPD